MRGTINTISKGLICILTMWAYAFVVPAAFGGPIVAFQPEAMTITSGATFLTPPVTVQYATGVSQVTLSVDIPDDVSINTGTSNGNLTCVTQGSSVNGLFFSEWDATDRRINITCFVAAGAVLEIIRSIQFQVTSAASSSQITLSGTVTGGTGTASFGSLALLPPHAINIASTSVTPSEVESGETASCTVSVVDSNNHSVKYAWSDGGKGGSFSPSASVQNPTYTAPINVGNSTMSVPLACVVTCNQNSGVHATGSCSLSVRAVPPNTISVTSTPNSGARIAYTPTPDAGAQASPKSTPCSLSFAATSHGVQLTAAKQDGATSPLWFDHWTVDGTEKTQGVAAVSIDMNSINHTASAVYLKKVGDLNEDSNVNKQDAMMIMKAVLGEIPTTTYMDVDLSGTVDLSDSEWILKHRS